MSPLKMLRGRSGNAAVFFFAVFLFVPITSQGQVYETETVLAASCPENEILGPVEVSVISFEFVGEITKVYVLLEASHPISLDPPSAEMYLTDDRGNRFNLISYDLTHVTKVSASPRSKTETNPFAASAEQSPSELLVPCRAKPFRKIIGRPRRASPSKLHEAIRQMVDRIDPDVSIIVSKATLDETPVTLLQRTYLETFHITFKKKGRTATAAAGCIRERERASDHTPEQEFEMALNDILQRLQAPAKGRDDETAATVGLVKKFVLHKDEKITTFLVFPQIDPEAHRFQLYWPGCGIIEFTRARDGNM